MASALGRMGLYVHYYGLSMDRLFATVFMFWLAIVFAWFGVTVLRGRMRDFAAGNDDHWISHARRAGFGESGGPSRPRQHFSRDDRAHGWRQHRYVSGCKHHSAAEHRLTDRAMRTSPRDEGGARWATYWSARRQGRIADWFTRTIGLRSKRGVDAVPEAVRSLRLRESAGIFPRIPQRLASLERWLE